MRTDRIQDLTSKFFAGKCSPEEKLELAEWIRQHPDHELTEVLETEWLEFNPDIKMPERTSERILGNIFDGNDKDAGVDELDDSPVRYLWPRIAAAAVLILSLGIYWWSTKDQRPVSGLATPILKETDILPGSDKAILILGDGSSITLDSVGNGVLASQGGTSVTQSGKGQLVYKSGSEGAPVFNTVSTPKGGQYHIVLPDGTGVWLNAASSLRFPTAFTGKQRQVEITGEVYFEVAHNRQMPFIVKSGETEIKVLGTHFNVMAYEDEKVMRTTLLEGAVKVTRGDQEALLAPGQQARIGAGNLRVVDDVELEKELSWKNGYFQFEDESLESIMRQVSRWYDVEIRYERNSRGENFTGRLPRNSNVSSVLKILSLSGVKFRIEDKIIIVTP